MKLKPNKIVIRLNREAFESYVYLRSIKVNPAVYFREGGETAIISKAKEMKQPVKKNICPF